MSLNRPTGLQQPLGCVLFAPVFLLDIVTNHDVENLSLNGVQILLFPYQHSLAPISGLLPNQRKTPIR